MAGEILKKRREELGFDIKQVADALKISSEYLISIEDDMFDKLPVAVYTIGYIRCYAKYLGVDAGPVIANFTSHLVSPKPPTVIPVSSSIRKVPGYVHAMLFFLAGLMVFAGYEYAGKEQPDSTPAPTVEKVGPPVEGENIKPAVPLAENSAPVTMPAESNPEANPVNESALAAAAKAEHEMGITASATVWIRIRFENGKHEEMLLRTGESKNWKFGGTALLRIGNAGGVTLKFDGKDLGVPGAPGKVLDLTLPQS